MVEGESMVDMQRALLEAAESFQVRTGCGNTACAHRERGIALFMDVLTKQLDCLGKLMDQGTHEIERLRAENVELQNSNARVRALLDLARAP